MLKSLAAPPWTTCKESSPVSEDADRQIQPGQTRHVAMSREVPGKREYVQHRIVEEGALVWKLLEDVAYISVSSPQTMRRGAIILHIAHLWLITLITKT